MNRMLSVLKSASVLPAFALIALSQSACSLVPIEVTADGKLQITCQSTGDDNTYEGLATYDPNDNEDYRQYKDQFERGEIESIVITVLDVNGRNRANWVAGHVDVRESGMGDDAWIDGVSAWGGLRLLSDFDANGNQEELADEIYLNPSTSDNYPELNRMVFQGNKGALDFRVAGIADQGPVDFDIEVTVTFTVEN